MANNIITPDTVINIAINENGYLEKSKEAYAEYPKCIYSNTDGAGYDNITKYGYEMHQVYPSTMNEFDYWCDTFVDWCFYKAYGVATAKSLLGGQFDDYTIASADMYKKKNAWYKTPRPGDQVFFNNGIKICHTGLVYKVDKGFIYTVEGNTSNRETLESNGGSVALKRYVKQYRYISGYGRPKYEVPATCMIGDMNDDVVLLQETLMKKGYELPRYGADGEYGLETGNAVKNFRAGNGLRITHKCDAECWKKLLWN